MIKITLNQENQRPRTIHLPYLFVSAGGRIATSKLFWKLVKSKINEERYVQLRQINWQEIQPLLKEMKKYKGLTIVDLEDDKGQVVKITL
ncbi:hypothetical protein [Bacillus niameyensis]|uniref:hypothetical protein n=1 Tax=Bacillus niameyensis TaxID=1522308 RepID=UPI000A67980D|nr:hypothetical protein [Bacillus niameyensis]